MQLSFLLSPPPKRSVHFEKRLAHSRRRELFFFLITDLFYMVLFFVFFLLFFFFEVLINTIDVSLPASRAHKKNSTDTGIYKTGSITHK